MKKILSTVTLILMFFFIMVQPSFAVSTPDFPSCTNPQGEIIADYGDGKHGIPGESKEFRGEDTVYRQPGGHVTQCFCPKTGDGIQTNWYKLFDLGEDLIKQLDRSGWEYIPTGSVWGLDDAPYMAKNFEYRCLNIGGADGSVLGTSSDSDSGGKVLGLASTGNDEFLYNLWLLGLVTMICGVWLKKISLASQK